MEEKLGIYGNIVIDEDILSRFYYEPHSFGNYKVYRRVLIMEKSGLLGVIGTYKLLDFIVINIEPGDLLKIIQPVKDVIIQRFLVFGKGKMIKKSFYLGLKGWAYVGFYEGKEKFFDDMRKELQQAIKQV
jgi:hypothetical protein